MKDRSDIDFDRALVLMKVIVEAGKHGPLYQKLASLAGEELKEIVGYTPQPGTVTPPAGPPNALVQNKDGSLTQRVVTKPDDTVTGEPVVEPKPLTYAERAAMMEPTPPVIERRTIEPEVRTGK